MDLLPYDLIILLGTYLHPAALRGLSHKFKMVADGTKWTRLWLSDATDVPAGLTRVAYIICKTDNLNYRYTGRPIDVLHAAAIMGQPDIALAYLCDVDDINYQQWGHNITFDIYNKRIVLDNKGPNTSPLLFDAFDVPVIHIMSATFPDSAMLHIFKNINLATIRRTVLVKLICICRGNNAALEYCMRNIKSKHSGAFGVLIMIAACFDNRAAIDIILDLYEDTLHKQDPIIRGGAIIFHKYYETMDYLIRRGVRFSSCIDDWSSLDPSGRYPHIMEWFYANRHRL